MVNAENFILYWQTITDPYPIQIYPCRYPAAARADRERKMHFRITTQIAKNTIVSEAGDEEKRLRSNEREMRFTVLNMYQRNHCYLNAANLFKVKRFNTRLNICIRSENTYRCFARKIACFQ